MNPATTSTANTNLTLLRKRGTRRPCTASIVLGTYSKHRFPGGDLFKFYCQRLQAAFPRTKRERTSQVARDVARLCTLVESRSIILDGYPRSKDKLIPMLISLAVRKSEWIRPLGTWEPDLSSTARGQYSSLLEHLFIEFPPPGFFKSVREARNPFSSREYAWYLHLGSGKSLRSAPDQPVELSKREAHHVMQAPDHLDVHEALLWGKLAALGAGSALISEIMRTNCARNFVFDSILGSRRPVLNEWLPPLVRLFLRTPGADNSQIGPLIDFLDDTTRRHLMVMRPDLKNQTLRSLTRLMEEWHAELNRYYEEQAERRKECKRHCENWPSDRGIRPLYQMGKPGGPICLWQLVELRSQFALTLEGREMRHCVSGYASRCASGSTSIWSLRTVSPQDGTRPVATIEVQKRKGQRCIAQARAHSNSRPDETAMRLIERWAKRNSIGSGSLP